MMKLCVTAASGLEAAVKHELVQLGYGERPAEAGRIFLEGDWRDIARLNVFLRVGERVLLVLGSFPAATFDELFEGVYNLPWEDYLTPHACIRMDGKSVKSKLAAIKAAGGVAKKAVLKRLTEKLHAHTFDERGERAIVGVSIADDIATVTLDTSGDGLHKRGYRVLNYDAPLKETTAAGLLFFARAHSDKPFADLFCGSGTLPVEAALSMLNIAPGTGRDFDFTAWKCSPKDALKISREEAEDMRFRGKIAPITGMDISEKAISIARFHAKRAGVEEFITFRRADMREFASGEKRGVLVSNPPYGERIGAGDDLNSLYKDFSRTFRRLDGWSCHFISGYPNAERAFGSRADKKRVLWNARLKCTLYSYFAKRGD